MRTNIVKNKDGITTGWTDINDNCTVKVINNLSHYFCSNCGNSAEQMKFIKETGYYEREVTMKCKCDTIVKYGV